MSANEPTADLQPEDAWSPVLRIVRKRLERAKRCHRVLDLDTPKGGLKYYLYPRITADLFEIG